ncbi:MAG: hypothetical protein DWQ19_10850 [Crenarchaeota archaeon]|nr:MAG: hypothetical protein DWQ19_10850 [Thermoproteota archaeon]
MFKKFTNYVEERKDGVNATGLAGNPKVKLVADYEGPDPKKPTKGEGQGDLNPYKAANKNASAKKAETGGFADMGDKNLEYTPDTKGGNSKLTSLGTEIKDEWPKGLPKTEQFFNKTKNMSTKEFAEFMVKECGTIELTEDLPMVNATKPGAFHPHPSEAIRYVAALSKKSPKVVEQLMHELKRANILGEVFKAALEYPEAYSELTNLFEEENEDGERRSRRFARALKEAVGPPMGLKMEPEEDEESPEDMDGEMGDEEMDMDDEMGDEEFNDEGDDMDDDDMDFDDEGDDDLSGDMDDEMGDEIEDEDSDMEMGPPSKFAKPTRKPSNLMNSMSKMGLN